MKKKLMALALAGLLLCGGLAVNALGTEEEAAPAYTVDEATGDITLDVEIWKYGDVNADDFTNVNDALQIQRYSAGKGSVFTTGDAFTQEYRLEVADVNGDGAVDVNDALQIQRYSSGKGSVLDNLLS